MEAAFIFCSDHAEAVNGKVYALGAGWSVLNFQTLPTDWRFHVSLGLDVDWANTNRRHELELLIEDPDGETLGDPFRLGFETGRPPGIMPGQEQRAVVSVETQQTFRKPGPHLVRLRVNGEDIPNGKARFYVLDRSGGRAPAPPQAG